MKLQRNRRGAWADFWRFVESVEDEMAKPEGYPPTPMHDKLKAAQAEHGVVVRFIDFLLDEKGMELAKWHHHTPNDPDEKDWVPLEKGGCWSLDARGRLDKHCGFNNDELYALHMGNNDRARLIGEFLGIDPRELEKEKVAILDYIRRQNS